MTHSVTVNIPNYKMFVLQKVFWTNILIHKYNIRQIKEMDSLRCTREQVECHDIETALWCVIDDTVGTCRNQRRALNGYYRVYYLQW